MHHSDVGQSSFREAGLRPRCRTLTILASAACAEDLLCVHDNDNLGTIHPTVFAMQKNEYEKKKKKV